MQAWRTFCVRAFELLGGARSILGSMMAKEAYQSDRIRSLMGMSTQLLNEGLGASTSSVMESPPPVRSDVIVMSRGQPQTLSFQGTLPSPILSLVRLATVEVTFCGHLLSLLPL